MTMPHLTGLAAMAATDSSSDKATTKPGFTDGISVWKDPMAAIKALPDTITGMIQDNPVQALGVLIIPIGLVLIASSMMSARNR